MPVSDYVSILPPADQVGASVDFVGRVDAISVVQSILALARITHDNVIVDLGGRLGPAAAAIIREADVVLVMLDDSLLGLSAARFFFPTLQSIVRNPDSIHFLCSGVTVPQNELEKHMAQFKVGQQAWSLPSIPFDAAAGRWPGSSRTLYSMGRRQTRKAFDDLALALRLVDGGTPNTKGASDLSGAPRPATTLAAAASFIGLLSPLRIFSHRVVNP
jgi:hypothetical protein